MTATTPREPFGVRLSRMAATVRHDAVLIALDLALITAAYAVVLMVRFEGAVPPAWLENFATFLPAALAVHVVGLAACGAYGAVWAHAGIVEARRVLLAGAGATVTMTALAWTQVLPLPRSVALVGGAVATGLMAVQRFHSRLFAFHRGRGRSTTGVVVIGAGEAGAHVVRELARADGDLRPVAVLDDDPTTHGRRLSGVPVCGSIDALGEVASRRSAGQALLAMPSADRSLVRRVVNLADDAGLTLKTLPRVDDLVQGAPSVQDVRDIAIEDLLGREPVATEPATVREAITGACVVILGAGGSIGSEIARQVAKLEPAQLVLVDNDETHLFEVAVTVGDDAVQCLADVRDADAMRQLFAAWRPEVVFHAAAHKHVPLLEAHPCEAVRTNVLGTANVVAAAEHTGVARLVFISTDKAVHPSSVMGASKRIGEQLVLARAPRHNAWSVVRFGNVLGSRGSVVPTFVRQIRDGGPVTVTDARMTRYFMSIPEAVELVLQAGAMADGGEVFMLDMGEPVRIVDLAERMIRLSGQRPGHDIEIRMTGPRPGEKLVEELAEPDTAPTPTRHSAITALHPPLLSAARLNHGLQRLRELARDRSDDAAATALLQLAHASEFDVDLEIRLPDTDHSSTVR